MASVDDRAAEVETLFRALDLSRRKPEGPAASGVCLCCGERIREAGRRWCDAECRDDWQAEHAA